MQFFRQNTPHYTTYLFAGNLMFVYFNETKQGGINSLMSNGLMQNVEEYIGRKAREKDG